MIEMKLVALANHSSGVIRFTAPHRFTAKQCSRVSIKHTRHIALATPSSSQDTDEDNFEGLLPEDDSEVPGTYQDAMSSNTRLGKLIKDSISELDTLGSLQMDVLNEAEALLKSAGFKGSLFDAPMPIEDDDDDVE